MRMNFLRSSWCPWCVGILFVALFLSSALGRSSSKVAFVSENVYDGVSLWSPPDINDLPPNQWGDQVRYGRELVTNTSFYLGPNGLVSQITNGMNCQNCHMDAGTKNFALPLSAVASTFPKYLERSERMQSVVDRVNDCLQRSLNGKPLDSSNYEMQAFVAYLKWLGHEVPKGVKPLGSGMQPIPFLERAADPAKGKVVYQNECSRCHGPDGQGTMLADKTGYVYPPLWGAYSYNVNATLYRLLPLAGFIKLNMPFDKATTSRVLTDEEAWDVAAYISSQPRPDHRFTGDWHNLQKKPIDHPYGPYADAFSEQQHKYGPFTAILQQRNGVMHTESK
jgi:thiosulfate dehydrogenase